MPNIATITVDVSEQVREYTRQVAQACQVILNAPDEQRDLAAARLRNGTPPQRAVAKHYEYMRMAARDTSESRIIADITPGWDRATVYLDDEPVHGCLEADSAAGYVIVVPGGITDRGWRPVEGDPFKKFGTVRIEFRAQTLNTPDPVPQAERQ